MIPKFIHSNDLKFIYHTKKPRMLWEVIKDKNKNKLEIRDDIDNAKDFLNDASKHIELNQEALSSLPNYQ